MSPGARCEPGILVLPESGDHSICGLPYWYVELTSKARDTNYNYTTANCDYYSDYRSSNAAEEMRINMFVETLYDLIHLYDDVVKELDPIKKVSNN